MSTSETDSEPELELATDTVSSLTAFAHLSATQPNQGSAGQETVTWAVDTLATLDFRLVRRDTALHGLIQNCASTILASFNAVLQQEPTGNACSLIPDVACMLRASFLHLLFQYRRLFRFIATRDFKLNFAPLAIVCWVDVILAKLGDVIAFIAAGFDGPCPNESPPQFLKGQREEDNLRAAIQLPDNWDMLPSMLLSERVSAAAKRLSIKLMFGRYILCPTLLGQVDVDNNIQKLLSTFTEFVRQSAARVDELRSLSGLGLRHLVQQERFTSAMAISLYAAANMAQDSTKHAAPFCPQTMAAAMQLLRFVLNEGGYLTQTSVLSPVEHLDIPTSVIIRWGVVPQWTWSIWLEYRSLHADTITCLTTTYIQHYRAGTGVLPEASDSMTNSGWSNKAAVISVIIDLIFRFISVLSTGGHLSTGMMNVLYESCRLISQWMYRNSFGIQNSEDCCKALIVLFGHLSQNEHFALNELVIECLALMGGQCTCDAWKAAVENDNFRFLEALGQSFTRTKMVLSLDDFSKSRATCVARLMQFLVVMMSKGVQPSDPDAFAELVETVGERLLGLPPNERGILCEMFLVCLATANLSEMELPFSKVGVAADDEAVWRLGMCNGDASLYLASALAWYMTSTAVRVDPLTYLEGLEHLVDVALLICSGHYSREDEPLALLVLPTICEGLAHLLEHRRYQSIAGAGAVAECLSGSSTRLSTLCSVLRCLVGENELSSRARRVLIGGVPRAVRKICVT